jgi:hypothetical protein
MFPFKMEVISKTKVMWGSDEKRNTKEVLKRGGGHIKYLPKYKVPLLIFNFQENTYIEQYNLVTTCNLRPLPPPFFR